jgi:hypothetical protein
LYNSSFNYSVADRSSGTSRDWAAGVLRIPFVYTVELRDSGMYGFLLPPDQILATGVETWEGVKAMMDEILRLDGNPRRPVTEIIV